MTLTELSKYLESAERECKSLEEKILSQLYILVDEMRKANEREARQRALGLTIEGVLAEIQEITKIMQPEAIDMFREHHPIKISSGNLEISLTEEALSISYSERTFRRFSKQRYPALPEKYKKFSSLILNEQKQRSEDDLP